MLRKETLITTAIILLITYTLSLSVVTQAFPAGQSTKKLSSTGSIQIQTTEGLGIYSDPSGITELTSVSWGTLSPGETSEITFYIKNEGSSPITLSLTVDNWSPTYPVNARYYMTVDWDYNNQVINPNGLIAITLSLSVDSDISSITEFGFDITIAGN